MTHITDIAQLDLNKHYTYSDYMSWRFKERVELFLGKVLKMSPAPNRYHQDVTRNMLISLDKIFSDSDCKVYSAPFDVHLPLSRKEGKGDTVVQPDIVVICDLSKLNKQGCNGAPDLVIEILSPGNSKREMKDKFELYEASKVPEYWIVDPIRYSVVVYSLKDNVYVGSKPFVEGERVASSITELQLKVDDVFRE